MAIIRRFEDIEAWRKARDLTKVVYGLTNDGALARDFALKDQMRRAAISVMANIAEGFERDGNKEFLQFLAVAKGSRGELRSHLTVASDQHYMTRTQYESCYGKAVEVSRMVSGLMRHLRSSQMRGEKYRKPLAPSGDSEA
jgi:four helix bundle protein